MGHIFELPKELKGCVAAYRRVNELEYIFFLKHFEIKSIRIKAFEIEEPLWYRAEILFPIKESVDARIILTEHAFTTPDEAVLNALKWFICCQDSHELDLNAFIKH
jgi:hypothetical protein